ncbi:glycosyltransferase family 61 protein [Alteromonas gilva]|uniref:Glycosyltransferase family 61 protein n=1 Tax=Alteromonas gilva TaxID=2987522 RepID=A0ABT5L7I5_9ALTE|nr:glycosyltransferase family 61 protein [Alteromonas gilva]MDC8833020.1 glycosyltransferase family 61 protein [Alteromonas gilva]
MNLPVNSKKTPLFNYNQTFTGALPEWSEDLVTPPSVSVKEVSGALVTKGALDGWPRRLVSGVFDSNLGEVIEGAFVRNYRVSYPRNISELNIETVPSYTGRFIYLGWIITHYGHFITESISRMWWLAANEEHVKDITILAHANFNSPLSFPSHVKEAFAALGISLSQIKLVKEDAIYESLIVPSQSMILDDTISERQVSIWNKIRDNIHPAKNASEPKRKVYLSRKFQDQKDDSRQFNDQAVEDTFRQKGFEIVYPEQLTFQEQIKIYAETKVLAGPVGSAMHNAAFMPNNGKVVILAPNSFLFKTDSHIAYIKEHTLNYFLVDTGSTSIKRVNYDIDTKDLANYLSLLIN